MGPCLFQALSRQFWGFCWAVKRLSKQGACPLWGLQLKSWTQRRLSELPSTCPFGFPDCESITSVSPSPTLGRKSVPSKLQKKWVDLKNLTQWFSTLAADWNHLGSSQTKKFRPIKSESPRTWLSAVVFLSPPCNPMSWQTSRDSSLSLSLSRETLP